MKKVFSLSLIVSIILSFNQILNTYYSNHKTSFLFGESSTTSGSNWAVSKIKFFDIDIIETIEVNSYE